MKKATFLAAALLLFALAGVARAEGSLVGLLQTWWSYTAYTDPDSSQFDATQSGFGVRRARIGYNYKGGDMSGGLLGDVSGLNFVILDAYGDWKFTEKASLRAGRFIGVQSQAAGLTSSAKIDLVERSIVGRRFGSGTVGGDYRTFGAQFTLEPSETFKLQVLAHNGSGSWGADFTPSNNSHGDPTVGEFEIADGDTTFVPAPTMADTGALPQLDFGISATPTPELSVGFTYGLPNEMRNTTGSMTAFVYYATPAYYFKFDYATLMWNPVWDDDDADFNSLGYSLTAGYNLNKKAELVGRYELWDVNTDVDYASEDAVGNPELVKNLGLGVNYYVNPDSKYDQVFKAAFTLRLDDMPDGVDIADPYLFQLMWQIYVH